MMARARRQLAIAHGAQLAAQRLGADRHRELVPDPLHKIDQTPAYDAVRRRNRATLDSRRQRRSLVCIEAPAASGGFVIDQAIRSVTVEPQHPVPHRSQANPTGARRVAPAAAVINHRQRQKPANLPSIAPRLRKPPQIRRCEVRPQTNRRSHRNLPRKGMLDHIIKLLGIARVSQTSRLLVLHVSPPISYRS
jgi:hypothetical protein